MDAPCALLLLAGVGFLVIVGCSLILLFGPGLMLVGGLLRLLSLLGSLLFGLLVGFMRLIGLGVLGRLRFGGFGRCMMSGWLLSLLAMP